MEVRVVKRRKGQGRRGKVQKADQKRQDWNRSKARSRRNLEMALRGTSGPVTVREATPDDLARFA